MRVLGIDPGYAIVGWGVVDYAGNRFAPVDFGAVCTDAGVPFERRLDEVYAGVREVIERTQPEVLAIEKLFYQHNQTTVIGVAEARGVILLAAAQAGLPIYEYTPMQVKQAVTGYGKAVKKQVQEMTRILLHLPAIPKPDDTADALDIMIGKGPSAQSIRINLPRFTLVGATTRAGQITGPLRDRFGVLLKLELYSPDELSRIIIRSAGILDQPITPEGAYELAKCSRGTPRVANRFLKRVRDFATVLGDGVIDQEVALLSLKRMDVDTLGLDELDRSLLRAIIEMYNGGPVGLETLAAALGEEAVTLEDLCEPYLMQMGFLTRTPRGRCATRLAYEHLGLKAPESGSAEDNGQQSLF